MNVPDVPGELVDRIVRGNCVLFVGAGLSQGAGLPGWPKLLRQMLDWSEKHGLDLADREELESYIKGGELLLVAEEMRERLGKDDFRRFMAELFRKPGLKPTDTHMLLPEIPFTAALTSNYDTLLESAYTVARGTVPHVFTQADYPELSATLRGDEFYVLKVHGTIDRIQTVVLGRSDYREAMHANPAYRQHLMTLFSTKTVLFLGFGLTDPDLLLLLEELRATFKDYTGKHYALMNTGEVPAIKQKRFESDYSIRIIPYTPSAPDHPEVHKFLTNLLEQVRQVQATVSPVAPETPAPPAGLAWLEASYLRRVQVSCHALPLAVIDPRAVERTRQQTMDLLAVYVALDTQTPVAVEGEEGEDKGKRRRREGMLEPGRETRPLTALEAAARERQMVLLGGPGSGKSTFVNYLALCLAGARLERLGEASALPGDRWLAHLEPTWTHGPLLPLQVTLRLFARSKWSDGTAAGLWNFLADTLATQGLADFAPYLRQQLLSGGVMVLLDGLDEVADPQERKAVREAVADFAATYSHPTNRYLVTCRGYAYQDPGWQLERFAAHALAPFNQKQIDDFIGCWYQEVCRLGWKSEVEAEDLTRRLQTATRRPDLAPLAASPLQLTMMASLHFSWGRLPEDRVELYQEMVWLLLVRWQEARLGEDVGVTRAVSAGKLESALERVAFIAHRAQEGPEGTADVSEEVLRSVLKDYLEGNWDRAGELMTYIKERAGLLLEREPGVYTFPHRSYQEYLAGSYLAVQPGFPDEAAGLIRENYAQWREVVLWAVGVMARLKKMAHVAVDVAAALCPHEVPDRAVSEADWRAAYLASEALLEIGLEEVKARERHEPVLARVQGWLVALIERGALTPVDRGAAGRVLARLGDPRPGVGLRPAGLPEIMWREIPAGSFAMGTSAEDIPTLLEKFGGIREWYEDEVTRHEVALPAFKISLYPITNAQYEAFVQAGGYAERRYWAEAEEAGVWQAGRVRGRWDDEPRERPYDFGAPFDLLNHPVVGVTWYEAMAFCRWLTECLRERGEIGEDEEVRLPSEAEWEKAARGTDGRQWPWGKEFDPTRCNVVETGIGATSTVGLFPAGASPYGVLDMAGNVWEWCNNLYRDYPYRLEDGREDQEAKGARVLRGGSWTGNGGGARCASRDDLEPATFLNGVGFRVVALAAS